MLNITRRDIEEAHDYARSTMRLGRDPDRKPLSSAEGPLVRGLEVVGAAAAVGVATGYQGSLRIFGGNPVPLDLAAGLALLALSIFGKSVVGNSGAAHAENLGMGTLAGYATKFGVGYGTSLRQKAGKPALALSEISGEGDGRQDGKHGHHGHQPRQIPQGQGQVRSERARNKQPMGEHELAAMALAVR